MKTIALIAAGTMATMSAAGALSLETMGMQKSILDGLRKTGMSAEALQYVEGVGHLYAIYTICGEARYSSESLLWRSCSELS